VLFRSGNELPCPERGVSLVDALGQDVLEALAEHGELVVIQAQAALGLERGGKRTLEFFSI
jgi:hypothetical protein